MKNLQQTRRLDLLAQPLFLINLFLLLINDFFLKQKFGNYLTGKLSDFSGLYCFCVFVIAFFPKYPRAIAISIACCFVFWKSPCSENLINTLNLLSLPIGRVVDVSDLFALPVLYLAIKSLNIVSSNNIFQRTNCRKIYIPVVSLLSLFAFCASHYQHKLTPDQSSYFKQIMKTWPRYRSYYYFPKGRMKRYVLSIDEKEFLRTIKDKGFDSSSQRGRFFSPSEGTFSNPRVRDCENVGYPISQGHIFSEEEIQNVKEMPVFYYASFIIEERKPNFIFSLKSLIICNFTEGEKLDEQDAVLELENLLKSL